MMASGIMVPATLFSLYSKKSALQNSEIMQATILLISWSL